MMHLCYSPVNAAFVFVFGESIESAQLIRMVGAPMFFETRQQAVEAAAFCGLSVSRAGRVESSQNQAVN